MRFRHRVGDLVRLEKRCLMGSIETKQSRFGMERIIMQKLPKPYDLFLVMACDASWRDRGSLFDRFMRVAIVEPVGAFDEHHPQDIGNIIRRTVLSGKMLLRTRRFTDGYTALTGIAGNDILQFSPAEIRIGCCCGIFSQSVCHTRHSMTLKIKNDVIKRKYALYGKQKMLHRVQIGIFRVPRELIVYGN